MSDAHSMALSLAEQSQAAGDPTGWLETLYASAGDDTARVPWADGVVNPNLATWLDRRAAHGGRTLVVGCGLGDDSEGLAALGYDVTAFDVAPSAVEWARRLHAGSSVSYVVGDLLDPSPEWLEAYDLVVEIYTVQVLRGAARRRALEVLPTLVAPGGTLLVIARGREDTDPEGDLPWPLTRAEVATLESALETVSFEDYHDEQGHRRFRVELRRP